MDKYKLQYLKENGYVEFDKEEIRKEFETEYTFPNEYIKKLVSKNKYYRLMKDGQKMLYSEAYLNSHSIEKLNEETSCLDKETEERIKSQNKTWHKEDISGLIVSIIVSAIVSSLITLYLLRQ